MCFSKCVSEPTTEWFDAAINNNITIIQQQMKQNQGKRELRLQTDVIFTGFTAFFYSVYHENLEVLSLLLLDEFTLPTIEPILFDEDQMIQSQVNMILPEDKQIDNENDEQAKQKDEIKLREKSKLLEKIKKLKNNEVVPEYNIREFPSNSTALDLAVHQSNWRAFDIMYESILFQPDLFSPILGYMNEHGETTLHFFVRNGSPEALYMLKRTGRILIEKEIDKEGESGLNPVVLSIRSGRVDFLEYFLSLAYDDFFFEKIKFCLRKQKRKPAVEELCTPSLMFSTTEEEAQQASFLLQGFRRRSLPPAPEWLVLEIREKIEQMNRSSYEEPIEEGPVAPWIQTQRDLNIHVDSNRNSFTRQSTSGKSQRASVAELPPMTPKLEHFISQEQTKQHNKDGLLHVYEQVALPKPKQEAPKVSVYGIQLQADDESSDAGRQEINVLEDQTPIKDNENSVEDL
ncbi:hypothetical protein SS50377_23709 [Spironucleus salmonicida]|uniref:Ankyrin repeat-containing protein n=1 Tax=Spironucleus salmonicida TaxID=348837 RepID=V6LYB4_9EUKA|nr:hypothetical protein SS50377_23709 [Spironucleus salmonicida]|eukprot:EST48691.1 Hypothetical protein SS50377_11304 [Spironucleus salmonicida]